MGNDPKDRVYSEGWNKTSPVGYKFKRRGVHRLKGVGKVCGVCIDFSGWDGTVTEWERLEEACWIASYYPEHLRPAILNCLLESAYAIVVDDDGNVWIRKGQRGSGELMTSIGNTRLASMNIRVSISESLGLTLEEVCSTEATLTFEVKSSANVVKFKSIELTNYPALCDGDDICLMLPEEAVRLYEKNAEESFNRLAKVIRSGNKAGMKICKNFEEIDFCSHSYEPVLIGPNASKLTAEIEKYIEISQDDEYRLWYLPTRPTADVLSKLRLTLKTSTTVWDKNDLKEEGGVCLTRSKVLSYLLLYPHIRCVRAACLTLLSITGDGSIEWKELIRRYDLKELLEHQTGLGALKSVYGVETLTDIGLIAYGRELTFMQALKYNVSLTGKRCKIRPAEYISLMLKFAFATGIVAPSVLEWDQTMKDATVVYVTVNKLSSDAKIRSQLENSNILKEIDDENNLSLNKIKLRKIAR